jgi:hypothetical protein
MNKIKVRVRASGAVIEIEESAFDATLHERVAAARTVGETPVDELMTGIGTATATAVATALREAGLGQVRRDLVIPGTTPAPAPDATAMRARYEADPSFARIEGLRPAWEARYLQLPEWERRVRSPESDVFTFRWAQRLAQGGRQGAPPLVRGAVTV